MKPISPILAVNDIERSVAFYRDVLGFTVDFTMPGEDGKIVHGAVSHGDCHLMFSPWGAWDGERGIDANYRGTGVVLYLTVDEDEDIDAYFERVKAAGTTVLQEPADQFWGHRDWAIADLDGYKIYISKIVRQVTMEELTSRELVGASAD